MSLNSLSLILIFPITTLINFSLPKEKQKYWLLFISLSLLLLGDIRFLLTILSCIIITYLGAIKISSASQNTRSLLLALTVCFNIGLIVAFRIPFIHNIIYPIGISFYTLQAVSYLAMVYRNDIPPEKDFISLALYLSFFPTVSSGPIERANKLLPQIKNGNSFDYDKARHGLYNLFSGFILKYLLADKIAVMVDYAYSNHNSLSGAAVLWGIFLYGFRLFADFAGYSLLALGYANMLGYDITINFKQPYLSTSVTEFWNRWHISLSSWLKNYIYIPLGGNKKGKFRKKLNLLITFMVSGLWHGIGLNYLVWGLIHALYQIVGHLLPKPGKLSYIGKILRIIRTFILIDFAWIFFRASSLTEAIEIIKQILFKFDFKKMTYYGEYCLGTSKLYVLAVIVGIAIFIVFEVLHEKGLYLEKILQEKKYLILRWTMYIFITLFIITIILRGYGESATNFIYADF